VRFAHSVNVPADRETVWAFVTDISRVATCVPGVESVARVDGPDGERYHGVMRVSLGPVRLALEGDVRLARRDEDSREADLRVAAADAQAGGSVEADVRLRAAPEAGGTRLHIETDARVMGRIGEFGQPIIKRKADQTMAQFAENLTRALAEVRT
jgi:carbon monoxide dehydrogenase subunit G